jgi:hypothetical protein
MHDGAGGVPDMLNNQAGSASWQLTTQTAGSMVTPINDSWICGGVGGFRNPDAADNPPTQTYSDTVLPQDYEFGYVVAVPSIFLGGLASNEWDEAVIFSVILECTTESMTKANAVSLAISQQ